MIRWVEPRSQAFRGPGLGIPGEMSLPTDPPARQSSPGPLPRSTPFPGRSRGRSLLGAR